MAEHSTLRHATLDDVPVIVEMARTLYASSVYSEISIDTAKVRQMLEKFIVEGQQNFLVVLSHDEGKPVGVLAAYAFQPLFSNDKIATEVLLWLEPEHRNTKRGKELLDAYEYWAKLIGVKVVQYGLLSSADPRLASFYERRGAFSAENIYYKKV